jgi:hypothetical protein
MKRISRRQNIAKTEENFRFLRAETGIHIHADLIFGLPGETLATFAESFNKLFAMRPGEIQMGILKRLRGTPIARHTAEFAMAYNPLPPYEVLSTATVPFAEMQRMKRFARYFELYHNSGDFQDALETLFQQPVEGTINPFGAFLAFSDWLYATTRQTHQFGLTRLYRLLFEYLTARGVDAPALAEQLLEDYDRHKKRKERLEFLRPYVPEGPLVPKSQRLGSPV